MASLKGDRRDSGDHETQWDEDGRWGEAGWRPIIGGSVSRVLARALSSARDRGPRLPLIRRQHDGAAAVMPADVVFPLPLSTSLISRFSPPFLFFFLSDLLKLRKRVWRRVTRGKG